MPNMDEVVRQEANHLCEHGNYHCSICEIKLLELTVDELLEANRLLIEEREQLKAEVKQWESAADFWNEKVAEKDKELAEIHAMLTEQIEKRKQSTLHSIEQDKEIQQHIKGITMIQDYAIDMSLLPQQALNVIHGTATQLLLKIKI